MPRTGTSDIDGKAPPFDRFESIQRLATARSGHASPEHARHQLYVARDKRSRGNVLIKLSSKPGIVYQNNLLNEIATLSTINRELPDSRYFPFVVEHGRMRDGRTYLATSLFDELPLATTIGPEPVPARMVAHLRTALEVAKALSEIHELKVFHVDLNPMNILYRMERGSPVIRLVDFESSYELARHSAGVFYDPPTTPGYCAPEITTRAPDARSDLFSLGAVLYTMLASYEWTWGSDVGTSLVANRDLDQELKEILLITVNPDPDKRYASVRECHQALAAYLERIWPGRSW
jgi:serine/threonine protein kinase